MINFENAEKIFIDGKSLTIETVNKVAFSKPGEIFIDLTENSKKLIKSSNDYIQKIVENNKPVYGINTGFGALSNKFIPQEDLGTLQVNLIRSHCTGVGNPFSRPVSRAIMLLRANCLASGFSGVSPKAIELLLDFINFGITPVIPEKGSVGASGDLAPLSHIALALIGEGEVEYQGKVIGSNFAIDHIGKKPIILGPKDGLGLINGTAVMAALCAIAVDQAEHLMTLADISSALTLDGVQGTARAYDPRIQQLKPHPGQIKVAQNLNLLLKGSEIITSHDDCGKVQDPYSLRCVPQVHGACRQTLNHAKDVLNFEINAVTDNPLIFIQDDDVISGGNFHGEALSFCMDYLSMGLAEICNICERRIEKMMNPTFSELPAFLTRNSGLNSGLMIAHVTAAALTSENKFLCHPASVDSVPTSTDKEDHVSMGVTAGRKLHEIIFNVKQTLAIELLCNTQAIEFQRPKKTSACLEEVVSLIRKHVPPIEDDRVFYKDIQKIVNLIDSREIFTVVNNVIGDLK